MNTHTLEEMPAGFNDEQSPYFVPVELREEYVKTSVLGEMARVSRQTSLLADRDAEEEAARRLGDAAYTTDRTGSQLKTDELLKLTDKLFSEYSETRHYSLEALARHQVRQDAAWRALESRRKYAESAARLVEDYRCPICAVSDMAAGRRIQSRIIATGLLKSGSLLEREPEHITSCLPCWSVAQQIYVERSSAFRVEGKTTRRDLIERSMN